MISAPVARNSHHGDGIETQSSSRVCCDFSLATEIRQDPAVCVSLPSNSIVKEQTREHKFVQRRTARFFRDDRGSTGDSGLKPQSFENLMPCEGGEAMLPASEVPLNNIEARVSTLVLENLSFFSPPSKKPGKTANFSALSSVSAPNLRDQGVGARFCWAALIAPRLFHNLRDAYVRDSPEGRPRCEFAPKSCAHRYGCWIGRDLGVAGTRKPTCLVGALTGRALAGLWGETAAGATAS